MRQSGDYGLDFEPTTENAIFAVQSAGDFLNATKQYLGL
jgi:uncharacterized protein (UPF0332 family)